MAIAQLSQRVIASAVVLSCFQPGGLQLPAQMGGHERGSRPGLCTPPSKRTTPLQRLIERDFKDPSEAEKRKIVRENVGQLFGFDFD